VYRTWRYISVRFHVGATGVRKFCLRHRLQTGSGTHPALSIQRVPWTLSLGVKRPERKADDSRPSSAEIKKT